MPTREEQWLVRAPDGTMATVLARTPLGALRRWIVKHPRVAGDVSLKLRGDTGEWIDYRVDR
jgi:hypothetical protein